MAQASPFGLLEVVIGGDTTSLDRAHRKTNAVMKDIEAKAEKFKASFNSAFFQVAPWLTMAGGIIAVGNALRSIGTDARNIETLHLQTGIATRELLALRAAVESTGGSMETLSSATLAFNSAVREASASSLSAAAQALAQLGISARNTQGEFVTLDEVLPRLADRFSQWADGAQKASIANALFGGSAADMTRTLNQGSEKIREAIDQQAKWGRSSEEAQKKALEFDKATADLGKSLVFLRDEAMLPLLPVLSRVALGLANGIKSIRENYLNERDAAVLKYFQDQYVQTSKDVAFLVNEEARLTQQLLEMARASDDFTTPAFRALNNQLDAVREKLAQTIEQQQKYSDVARSLESPWKTEVIPADKPSPKEVGLPVNTEGLQLLQRDVDDLLQKLSGLPNAFDEAFTVNSTSYDDVRQAIDTVTAAYRNQTEVVHRMHQMKLQLARQEQDTIMETAQMIGSTLTAVFGKSKAAAVGQAIINTAVGVTRAFRDVPWPYNLAQAALVAATGAAQIAAINSASPSGGGSAASSGTGSAGAASSPVPQEAPSRSLTIQGVDRASLYSGDVVASLIKSINEEVQNGATLIATRNLPV